MQSMIWTYVWLLTLFFFLIVPFCFTKEHRIEWMRRWKEGRWNVSEETGSSPQGNNGGRFAMTRAQEDDIRKWFILECLRHYSKDITASDVKTVERPRLPTETTVASTVSMDIESALPANGMDAGKKDSEKGECTDECSSDDAADECSSDDVVIDDDPMDEFMADSEATITIPLAGTEYHEDHGNGEVYREVPNGCAICLCAFDESDAITWSSNASCNHVFHRDCIVDWFVASGRKALQRQRRQEARAGVVRLSDDALKRITSCPMLCPCCRQEFATPPPDNLDDHPELLDKSNNSTITETLSGNSSDDSSPTDSDAAVVVTGDDAV